MAKSVKRKAPSRVMYEQTHPTVSCRVPREVYDRLKAVKEADGRSFAYILKGGLGIFEPTVKKEAEARKRGHADGYKQGYAEAEQSYKVTYPCAVCGKTIELKTEKERQAAATYMREHGWVHGACHERNR